MRKLKKRSTCPISYSLDLLGDKWVMLILRDIALAQKHFYKDFLEAGEHIATNVLSDRLKMLEQQNIIKSQPYEKNKIMKFYFLTEKGIELIPLIIELWVWGARHDADSSVSQAELQKRLLSKSQNIDNYIERARSLL